MTPIRLLCLAPIALTLTAAPAFAQLDYKLGDADGDGCIGIGDLTEMITLVQIGAVDAPCFAAVDINENGVADSADLTYVLDLNDNPPASFECQEDLTTNTCGEYSSCALSCKSPCVLEDNGNGTVDLPPVGCAYQSPEQIHMLVDGLPEGTTVNVSTVHGGFSGVFTTPGGPLGGETETFDSKVHLEMQGTGTLASFSRVIELDAPTIVDTGPRDEGASSQTFATAVRSLEADLTVPDPDFATLSIRAGSDHGLPSPGQTTLTETNSFGIDSAFNVSYEITFTGEPGGALDGVSGTTSGTVSMETDPFLTSMPSLSRVGLALLVMGLTIAALVYGTRWRETSRAHRHS